MAKPTAPANAKARLETKLASAIAGKPSVSAIPPRICGSLGRESAFVSSNRLSTHGALELTLTVPNSSGLAGTCVIMQALAVEKNRVVASNGAAIRFGK